MDGGSCAGCGCSLAACQGLPASTPSYNTPQRSAEDEVLSHTYYVLTFASTHLALHVVVPVSGLQFEGGV